MGFLRLPLGSFMSRTIKNSGIGLPGARSKRGKAGPEAPRTEPPDIDYDVEQSASHVSPVINIESKTPSPFESATEGQAEIEAVQEPLESPTTSLGDSNNGPEEESAEDIPGVSEDNPPPSLADILADPLPPELSVDNLISTNIGNIFQKSVVKDSHMQALLDRHDKVDMRELVAELREFADEIGANKDPR